MKSIVIIVSGICTTLFGAYVYSLIWLWYIIPIFSVPILKVSFIFMFMCVYSMLNLDSASILKSRDRGDEDTFYIIYFNFIGYLMILLMAWLLTL